MTKKELIEAKCRICGEYTFFPENSEENDQFCDDCVNRYVMTALIDILDTYATPDSPWEDLLYQECKVCSEVSGSHAGVCHIPPMCQEPLDNS